MELEQAFAKIREQRDKLNQIDDQLSEVIRHVEATLTALKPGVPVEMDYETADGTRWIVFQKHSGEWRLMWTNTEEEWQTPLASASRAARAEMFVPGPDGRTPLETLVHEIPEAIAEIIGERQPLVDRARTLAEALSRAGFPSPQR